MLILGMWRFSVPSLHKALPRIIYPNVWRGGEQSNPFRPQGRRPALHVQDQPRFHHRCEGQARQITEGLERKKVAFEILALLNRVCLVEQIRRKQSSESQYFPLPARLAQKLDPQTHYGRRILLAHQSPTRKS